MSGLRMSRAWILVSLAAVLAVTGSVSGQVSRNQKRPRRVFVPIEDLGVVIDRDRSGVMLERDRYDALRALAAKNEKTQPRSPAALVLREVVYTARPRGDHLLIDASVRLQQFARGWQSLQLPLRGVSVETALVDGKPARVARFQMTRKKATVTGLELFHDTVGVSTLQLGLSTPLASVGSDKVAAFGLVPAATASLVVHLPAGKHLLVDGLAVRRPAPADQPATYNLPVGGRSDIRLSVTDRQTQRAGDALVFASTAFGIGVAPGEVTWQAITSLEVYGQALDEFVATVPRNLEITDVSSSGLESWELADDPDNARRTRITLRYRQRFTGSRRVTFRGVMPAAVGQLWQVPRLRLSGVTSHIGQILVQSPPGVRLQSGQSTGVRRVTDVMVLKTNQTAPAGSSLLHFDAWREDFTLSFATETKRQELQAALATILRVSDDGLDLATEATIESLFSSLFQVVFSMPEGWNITGVRVANKPVAWQRLPGAEGRQRFRVGFDKAIPEGTEVGIRVLAHRDLENWPLGSAIGRDVPLPDVAVEMAGGDREDQSGLIVEGRYLVRAPDEYEIVASELVGLDQANLELEGQRLGYMYQAPRVTGTLRIGRRPPRLSAQSLTVARLDRETVSVHLETHLDIQGGGARTVVIDLPEWIGQDLRFRLLESGNRIVEQLPADPEAGRRLWTLKLDKFVRNRLSLAVDLTLAHQQVADEEERFRLPTLAVVGAERDNGFVAIEASDDQRIVVTALERAGAGEDVAELTEIDPIDLPPSSFQSRERIVKAYRYMVPGYQVSLDETRFDHGRVARAICHSSTVTSVLARTGEMQHRAAFDLTAAGVQNLVVDLGAGSKQQRTLWAVTVDGRPVKAHRQHGQADDGSQMFVVGWPIDTQGSGRHSLEVFFRSGVQAVTGSGRLEQDAPVVFLKSGSGTLHPIEVLEQEWVVHHPRQTLVVASDGRFVPSEDLSQISLLGTMRDSLGKLSPQNLVSRMLVLLAVTGVIAVLTLAFRRRRFVGLAAATAVLLVLGTVLPFILLIAAPPQSLMGRPDSLAVATDSAPAGMDSADAPADGGMMNRALVEGDEFTMEGIGAVGGMGGGGGMAPAAPSEAASESPVAESADRAAKSEDGKTIAKKPAPPAPPASFGQSVVQSAPGNVPDQTRLVRPQVQSQVDTAVRPPASPRGANRGAVMSLALNIKPPEGTVRRHFHFLGSRDSQQQADLDIVYQDLESQSTARGFFIVLVLVGCWFFRQRPVSERVVLVIAALVGPMALVTVLPVWCHLYLDGLFLGATAGGGLWLAIGMVGGLGPGWAWLKANLRRDLLDIGAGLVLAASLLSQDGWSQDKSRPAPPVIQPLEVVPVEPGQDPKDASRVLLPRSEFLRLWNLAYPDRQVLSPAPRSGVVSHASWTARVVPAGDGVGARIAVRGELQLYSFRNGQVVLPIPIGSVAIGGARLNGKAAPLVTRAKPGAYPLAVVLERRGAHRLEVDCEVPLVQAGPAGQFSLNLAPVPAGRLRFELPERDLLVRVNGSTTRHRRGAADENEWVELGVNDGGVLRVAWQPRQAADGADGLVQLESFTSVHVSDPGVRHRGHFRFRVRQGGLPEAAFELPASVRVQAVTGVDVGGWDVVADDNSRRLRVFFRRRITDETVVQIELFQDRRVGDQSTMLKIESLGVAGFDRDKGQLAVFVDSQFTVRSTANTNLRQVDVAQAVRPSWCGKPEGGEGSRSAAPPQLVFGYITRPFGLTLSVSRRTPRANAVARHGVRIEHRKVRLASRIQWQLSQAARGNVTFSLPLDYLPVSVEAAGLADWFVHAADDGNRRLTVEFDRPRTGSVEVVLEGSLPRSPEFEELELALPHPLGVERLASRIMVWLDEAYSAGIAERSGWRPVDPASADRDLRQLDAREARFAFVHGATVPAPILLTVKRAVPAVQATVVSLVTVTDTLVDHSLALSWRITQAAADEFVFTTPPELKQGLQFRDPRIREVRRQPTGDDPSGPVRWIVTLNEPVRDRLFLIAQATLPPPSAQSVTVGAPEVVFEQSVTRTDDEGVTSVSFHKVETQQRYAFLVNQSTGTLTLENEEGVEEIKKDDLGRLPIRIEASLFDQATGMWRVLPRANMPRWKYQRSQAMRQTTATVQLAELVTVLAADGSWRTQAVYKIRNRAQQFLGVRIPKESEVLSVSVNGQLSRPVDSQEARAANVVLIALPNTSEGDLSFPVRLIVSGRFPHQGRLPTGFHLLANKRVIPVPRVVPPRGQQAVVENDPFCEYGMKVEETSWTVHLPDALDVEPVEGPGTNLALVSSDRIQLNQRRATLEDANYLLGVLKSKSSAKAKYNAAMNLKELEADLSSFNERSGRRQRWSSASRGTGAAAFQRENRDFQEKYHEALDQIQVDDAKQQVTIVDESGSLQGQDEAVQREQINQNNGRLFMDNSVVAPGKDKRLGTVLKSQTFNFQPAPSKPDSKANVANTKGRKRKPAGAAGVVSGKLGTRELRRRRQQQSLSQIAGLNADAEKEEQKKAATVQRFAGNQLEEQREKQREDRSSPFQPNAMAGESVQTIVGGGGGQGRVDLDAGYLSSLNTGVAGGLSVEFDIPTGGQKLQFATTGENPMLELSMRPRESIQQGLNLLWAMAWLVVGSGVIVAVRRVGTLDLLRRHLAKGFLALGLISFLLLPVGLAWMGFLMFLTGLIVFAFQNRVARSAG